MKLALVRLGALGDIIQAASVLQFLKRFKKNIEIHWFVDAKFQTLLAGHPLIDRLYALPIKQKKILKSLKIVWQARKNNYDAIIDLQGLIKSALISRLLGANNFGFDKNSLKERPAHNFYNQKFQMDYNANVFVRYLALCSFVLNADFDPRELAFKQDLFPVDTELKNRLIKNLKLENGRYKILIQIGASVEYKIYPITKYAILCKLITTRYPDAKIFILWGSVKEYELARELLALDTDAQVELAPKFSYPELVAFTKMMDLVIGNDSGPTHLAFAMNRPSITIFGPTPARRCALTTQINKTIDAGKEIPDARQIDKSDLCITKIDEEDIFALVCELLDAQN